MSTQVVDAYRRLWKDKLVGTAPPAQQHIDRVTRISALLPHADPTGAVLVDVGCGSGALLARAEAKGYRPIGLELDAAVVAWLTGHGYVAIAHDGDSGSEWPIDTGAAAVVVLCDVIEHLFHPAWALQEARRVLRPGGLVFVGTPNACAWRRIQSLARGEMFRTSGDDCGRDGGHVGYYGPRDLAALLQATGFTNTFVQVTNEDPAPDRVLAALHTLGCEDVRTVQHAYVIGEGHA